MAKKYFWAHYPSFGQAHFWDLPAMSKKLWVKFSIFVVTNMVKMARKYLWVVNKPIFWAGLKSFKYAYNLPRIAKYMYAKIHCDHSNGLGVY